MTFRTISTGLLAGLLSGICLFLIQRTSTLSLIHTAETYEKTTSVESASDAFAKEPMRSVSTLLGDVFVAVGFSLILAGIYALSGKDGWFQGLLWGLAGFASFNLAPAIVVPPAVPGMEVAPLLIRQTGWLVAATSTIIGFVLLFKFAEPAKLGSILFFALPAVVFRVLLSVQPATTQSHSLARLDQAFVSHTLGAMLLFWAVLGTTSGYLFARARRKSSATFPVGG
jgi:cobalt transporter subunit CbtA